MTGNSNSKNSEPQQPEHDASASSTAPSKPVQLDLFELTDRHRWRDTRNAGSKREPGSDRGSVHLRPLGGRVSSARLLATTDYPGHQSVSRAGMAEA